MNISIVMAKVTMNHQHKVAQNSSANFHHHETCITLCDDARNKNLKLRHLASLVHFVMFVFVICSFSYCCIHVCSCFTFSCLLYLLFTCFHIVILHIWFVGCCSLIFTSSSSCLQFFYNQLYALNFANLRSTFCSNFQCSNFLHHFLVFFFVVFDCHFCENNNSLSM